MSHANPRDATLQLPASFTVRYEIAAYGAKNSVRAMGAALGACWRGVGRPHAKYEGDVAAYAEQVINELESRPAVTVADILQKGTEAYMLIAESIAKAEDLETEVGNSDAGTEGSTPV